MLAGQTAYKDGYQCALLPFDYLSITQEWGSGSYSHCCNLATDWAAPGDASGYPYYAPCDCYMLGPATGGDNICRYRSAAQVLTPSGVRWLSFLFMHNNNPPAYTPNMIPQGSLIGYTGTAGIGTGPHCHLDQANGQAIDLYNSGVSCLIGVDCYKPYNEIAVTNAFFITGDEQIVNTGSLIFTRVDGASPPVPGGNFKWWYAARRAKRLKEVII